MATVYLRNVPDDVVDRLKAMAAREGMSLSAFAARELAQAARRCDNAALVATLPSYDIDSDDIVAAVHEGRRER